MVTSIIPKFDENVKKIIKVKDTVIDGVIFNIHCMLTAVMLLFASGVVATKEFWVGERIQCISDFVNKDNGRKDYHKVMETFCWINSTYTSFNPENSMESKKVYRAYYQWVCYVLFFQALIFYAPKWMWKHTEGKLMKHLQAGENVRKPLKPDEEVARKLLKTEEMQKKSADLVNYFALRFGVSHFPIWTRILSSIVNYILLIGYILVPSEVHDILLLLRATLSSERICSVMHFELVFQRQLC